MVAAARIQPSLPIVVVPIHILCFQCPYYLRSHVDHQAQVAQVAHLAQVAIRVYMTNMFIPRPAKLATRIYGMDPSHQL